MDLSDGQRKALFACVAVVLIALGVFLTLSAQSNHHTTAARGTATTQPPAPTIAPSSLPTATQTTPPGQFDIYSLLPFDQAQFATASNVAQQFTTSYGTYSYNQSVTAYAARLRTLATNDVVSQVEQGASAPGLVSQEQQGKEVSVGSATVNSIRNIGTTSIIFVVTGYQQITSSGKSSTTSTQYAVTVQNSGGAWMVSGFQPSNVGNS